MNGPRLGAWAMETNRTLLGRTDDNFLVNCVQGVKRKNSQKMAHFLDRFTER